MRSKTEILKKGLVVCLCAGCMGLYAYLAFLFFRGAFEIAAQNSLGGTLVKLVAWTILFGISNIPGIILSALLALVLIFLLSARG